MEHLSAGGVAVTTPALVVGGYFVVGLASGCMQMMSESDETREWSALLGLPFHEVLIETNAASKARRETTCPGSGAKG